MDMDERKRKVLTAIVNLYTAEGEPVGSNLLSQYLDLRVSSATLRNEMAALTRLGLLIQPHTSAGRVPSLEGYRYYMENLMKTERIAPADKQRVDELFGGLNYDTEKLLQGAAAGLSEMTGYTAIATSPHRPDMVVAHYEVLQVGRYSAAIVGVSQAGVVASRVANARRSLTAEDIHLMGLVMNTYLTFVSPRDMTPERTGEMVASLGTRAVDLAPLFTGAVRLLGDMGSSRLYIEGQERLLDYPELDTSLRGIISLFGAHKDMEALITRGNADTQCLFGTEIPGYYLPGLCLLSAKYAAGGGMTGAVALAGPARMDYLKLIPLMKYFTGMLSRAVSTGGKED